MKVEVNYVILSGSVVVNFQGKTFNIASTDGRYHKILEAIKADKLELIPDLTDTTIALKKGGVDIRDGVVFMDNKALPDSLSDRVLQFFNEGLPYEPLLKFWKKLQRNPSYNSRMQLFKFLEHNGHPITTEGNFIAYRSVRSDFKDHHTGKMDNSVGQLVKVDRSDVDDNPNNTCSNGLHVACLSYAQDFGGNRVIVDVEVNPLNVVAVPTDYNGTKMRVCEFKVLAVSEGLRQETLAESGYESDDLDYDDSFDRDEFYKIEEVSDEFRTKLENVIINFLVEANCLLTEKELATSPIGQDLWEAIYYNDSFVVNGYQNGEKLCELSKKFEKLNLKLDLQNQLRKELRN